MKEIIVLSSKNYADAEDCNYGDCTIINTGSDLFVYDCGSPRHAEEVIKYMVHEGYRRVNLILSHNDSDHFNGIPVLIEANCVSSIITTLLLKPNYVNLILQKIKDARRSENGIREEILEKYSNIASLSGQNLVDVYSSASLLPNEISVVGPAFGYMIETVSKNLDSREGDSIDGESVYNATSIQLAVKFGDHRLLLTGDASYAAIADKIYNYDIIQLPHHGKVSLANSIFEAKLSQVGTVYLVSDNTGASKGGSDDLNEKGHILYNTRSYGDIRLSQILSYSSTYHTGKSLGVRCAL